MTLFNQLRRFFQRPLSCEAANQFLDAYIEGDLDPATREAFESHLHLCPKCPIYLEQYRQTIALVHDYGSTSDDPAPAASSDLIDHTLDFLEQHWNERNGR